MSCSACAGWRVGDRRGRLFVVLVFGMWARVVSLAGVVCGLFLLARLCCARWLVVLSVYVRCWLLALCRVRVCGVVVGAGMGAGRE